MTTATFDGKPLVIGQVIRLEDIEYTVVEVNKGSVKFDVSIVINDGKPVMLARELGNLYQYPAQVTFERQGQLVNREYHIGFLTERLKCTGISFGTLSTTSDFT